MGVKDRNIPTRNSDIVFRCGFQIKVFNIFKKIDDNMMNLTTELEFIKKEKNVILEMKIL